MSFPTPGSNPRPPDDDSPIQGRNWFSLQIVKLICRFTPTCREVTRLLSQNLERPLPLPTRLNLKVHFLACAYCRRYEEHLHVLRRTARQFPECVGDATHEKLSPEQKKEIKEVLSEESDR